MLEFPEVESAPLRDLVLAVRKRSKALRKKVSQIVLERRVDEALDPPMEKLEVALQQGTNTSIRVQIWADRWVWVDARQSSKRGWVWSCTFEGRLGGGKSSADLLKTMEEFLVLLPIGSFGGQLELAPKLWGKVLLKGPGRLVSR